MVIISVLGIDRSHACFSYKAMERVSLSCHLYIWEVEMSLLSEACYCCGEWGPCAWPLNAQMTPSEI